MYSEEKCTFVGCESKEFFVTHRWNGERMCKEHYLQVFQKELDTLFENWDGRSEPSMRLRYLVGRYYSEFNTFRDEKMHELTQAIVRDRSYDWKKTKDGTGVIFTVIRFPCKYGVPSEKHYTWCFDNHKKTFTFLRERRIKRSIAA
jgi:hypothetical protein